MAGDWIKIERDLPHKPEVMQMAEILDMDELQVVGHLVLFWSWCDANMSLDCPDVNGTKRGLDRASCRDGMVDALVTVGWLSESVVDGRTVYSIPHFERHLSKSAKTRANEQRKKQRQRSCPAANGTTVPRVNGTQPGPEKRREEKKRKEVEGAAAAAPKRNQYPKHFEDVWNVYPKLRRKAKGQTFDAYQLAVARLAESLGDPKTAQMFLLEKVTAFSVSHKGQKYPPEPKRWFSDECYEQSPADWAEFQAEQPTTSVWPQIVSFLSRDDLSQGYSERLTNQFGESVTKAIKAVGAQKIAQANEFQLSTLSKQFEAEMKA
jgi:hypothetical protein